MIKFHTGKQLLELTKKEDKKISEIAILREIMGQNGNSAQQIWEQMEKNWNCSKAAIKMGLKNTKESSGGMVCKEGKMLREYLKKGKSAMCPFTIKAVTYAISNNICNACMGLIVSCPTAGASGVIPGVLLAAQEELKFSDDEIIKVMFTTAGVGIIIAENATLSGAKGGCQAEIGSAAAMAAAALTELRGGSPEECLNAAALALKNLLGLACDPVGGLVEIPCVKRNGFGATHAITASEMSLAGIKSFIPFDEVVSAMDSIGQLISPKLRETALGGLAITDTAKKAEKSLGLMTRKL